LGLNLQMIDLINLTVDCLLILTTVDVSYVSPQAHGIVNVALHREYSPRIVFIFFPREEESLSCQTNTGSNSNEYY
jgi:hypothetical protein